MHEDWPTSTKAFAKMWIVADHCESIETTKGLLCRHPDDNLYMAI